MRRYLPVKVQVIYVIYVICIIHSGPDTKVGFTICEEGIRVIIYSCFIIIPNTFIDVILSKLQVFICRTIPYSFTFLYLHKVLFIGSY